MLALALLAGTYYLPAIMGWNVLYVKPRCEKKMAEFCKVYGIEHYLPLRLEKKIYQRRKIEIERPVFPGYIFATYDVAGRDILQRTNDIVRIIEPPSDAELVFQLDQIRKALTVDVTLGAVAALARGRHVRITGGPFMGVEGIIHTLKGTTKVILNVEMINRAVAVEVEREYIELFDA
ncbi:MAG: hypothetical protein C0404_01905 [Verrucomicrobia bacterium]|nr:hypothetical protein [Verrucomicrobiota bacterium]